MKAILLAIVFAFSGMICFSQKKVALVIGNGAYQESPLRNPVNDALDIAKTLRNLGFTVTLKTNLNKRDMETSVRTFKANLASQDIALFYYSGHGMQVNESNYLIPVGETIISETDIRYNAMEAQYVMDYMKDAGTSVNIIILDACRDNPFKGVRSQTKGFVAVSAPKGTFIAYSTAPGTVAYDGTERNSPYTKNLIVCIKKPGIKIEDAFKEVRRNVMNETSGRQVPWESSSLIDDFLFMGSKTSKIHLTAPMKKDYPITIDNVRITKKLPQDFLASINIGTSIEFVKEKFGAPRTYFERPDGMVQLGYSFENLDIMIQTKGEKRIDGILLILNSLIKKYQIFPLYGSGSHKEFILGQLKFKDLFYLIDDYTVDVSSKGSNIYIDEYFGNPGKYYYYRFASYMGYGCGFSKTANWDIKNFRKIEGDFLNEVVNSVFITNDENELN